MSRVYAQPGNRANTRRQGESSILAVVARAGTVAGKIEIVEFFLSALEDMGSMCRNIKPLFNFDPPVTPDEVRAASLQFVRKISGFNRPSKANERAFLAAVDEIANISARLLGSLETTASPRNREEEAPKAEARAMARFGAN